MKCNDRTINGVYVVLSHQMRAMKQVQNQKQKQTQIKINSTEIVISK